MFAVFAKTIIFVCFRNWIKLRNTATRDVIWHGTKDFSSPDRAHVVKVPVAILDMSAVTRVINFSTVKSMEHLRFESKVLFKGRLVEWYSETGSVSQNSTNTWESTFVIAPISVPAKVLR